MDEHDRRAVAHDVVRDRGSVVALQSPGVRQRAPVLASRVSVRWIDIENDPDSAHIRHSPNHRRHQRRNAAPSPEPAFATRRAS